MKKLLPIVVIVISAAFLCTAERSGAVTCPSGISYGETIDCSIDAAGETDSYTFAGSSGERVYVKMARHSGDVNPDITIKRPDGTQLCRITGSSSSRLAEGDCQLDATGTHTIVAADYGSNGTGVYSLHLQRTSDPVGTITPIAYGEALAADGLSLGAAEMDIYTFTGASGDRVFLKMAKESGDIFPGFRLYRPNGTLLCNQNGPWIVISMDCLLDTSGTYTLLAGDIRGAGDGPYVGAYSLYLQRTNGPVGPTTPIAYGQTLEGGSFTLGAKMGVWTFAGASGERVFVKMARDSGDLDPEFRVYAPDGTFVCMAQNSPDTTIGSSEWDCLLGASGTYTVLAGDWYGPPHAGYYSLHLQRTGSPVGARTIFHGDRVSGSLGLGAQTDAYTFYAIAGETAQWVLDFYPALRCPELRFYRPGGGSPNVKRSKSSYSLYVEFTPTVTSSYIVLAHDCYGTHNMGPYTLKYGQAGTFNPWNPTHDPNYPQAKTKDPVNTVSGDFLHSHTDLAIPGRGVPLEFTRYYNSRSDLSRRLGRGWTHTYDMYLTFESTGVNVFYPQGNSNRFVLSGGVYVSRPGVYDTLVKNGDGTYTLTTKAQLRYNFSDVGRLTSIVDRNNSATTVSYDGNGYLASVTDAGGRSLTFTVDTSGRITQVSDPLGRTVGFQYDGNGDLVMVTDVKGGQSHFTYSAHRLLTITDSLSNTQTTNIYDADGRVAEQTDALGGKTCIYYGYGATYTSAACPGTTPEPTPSQTIVVDPRGNPTTYDFDDSYRTTKITDTLDGVIEYQYDSNNNLLSLEDQDHHVTSFIYDSRGNVTRITDALLDERTFAYTPLNDIDLETDPRGNMTDYGYDPAGNLTSITRKDSGGTPLATTVLTRDPGSNGDLTAVTDANGHTTTYTYDSHGLLDTVDGPLAGPPNDITDYNFDAGGRLSSVTDAESNTTSYLYDNQNNVSQVTDALNQITSYGYDAKGNRTSVADARRQPVGPPETGEQCGVSGTGDGVDDDGDTVKDDGCPSTRFVYDDADHLQSVIDAWGRATSYEYDAAGDRSKRTDARGLLTEYKYDALSRLYRIEHWNGEDLVDTVDYTYYADGLRETMTDPTGTTSYEYFDNHQLKKVTDPQGNVLQYTYDTVGNRETITYPGSPSKTVSYTYDAFNRMKTVTDWLGNVTTYNYDDVSNLTSTVYPASTGLSSTRDYDDADHLLALTNTGGSGTISSFSYTLDAAGNRTQMSDNTGMTSYQYDDLYRLTQVTYPGPSTTGYSYDAVGNRLTLTDGTGVTTYVYDAADQISYMKAPGQPAVNYTWDNNGNLTWRGTTVGVGGIAEAPDVTAPASHGSSGPPLAVFVVAGGLAVAVIAVGAWRGRRRGPVVMMLLALTVPLLAEREVPEAHAGPAATPPAAETFTYDHENRLVQASVGGTASAYTYNGDGLRVSRTVGGTTASYVWDAGSALPVVLQETTGGQTTYYVYGLDLISSVQGTTATYYLTDGLGSTTQLTDGAGAVAGAYAYDVFGSVRSHSGATTEWSFTGEQNDPTGLEFLRARYYDPALGRFLSRDPFSGYLTMPQTLNRYPYVLNNPVNYIDPFGLDCELNPLHWGQCAQEGLEWVGEQAEDAGYVDVGVSGCLPLFGPVGPCVTGGAQFGWGQGFHPYVGGGVGMSGGGLSVNFYPGQEIVEGLQCGFSGGVPLWPAPGRFGVGPGWDVGWAGIGNKEGGFYWGTGLYAGTTGASLMCSYVW